MSDPRFGPNAAARGRGIGPAAARAACALALVLGVIGAGCTVLTSETPEQLLQEGEAPKGVYYALPLSVMDLKLSVDETAARFILTVTGPRSIADPHHRYVLRYRPLPNYDDDVDVAVNGKMFLTSVNSTTKDQTPQIIVNLFRFFGRLSEGLEAGEAAKGEKVLAVQTVNPTDRQDVRRVLLSLNKSLLAYAKSQVEDGDECGATNTRKFSDYTARAQCLTYKEYKARAQAWIDLGDEARWQPANFALAPIKFHAELAAPQRTYASSSGRHSPARGADCTTGICYRPLQPYHVIYSVGLSQKVAAGGKLERESQPGFQHHLVLMPNDAPLIVIDIRRAFFVQKIQNIKFNDSGFLQYFAVNKESELLALAKLPVDILSSVVEVFRFRGQVLDQQKREADAMKGLIEQRRELEKQRLVLESALDKARAQEDQAASTSDLPPVPQSTPQSGAVNEQPGVVNNL